MTNGFLGRAGHLIGRPIVTFGLRPSPLVSAGVPPGFACAIIDRDAQTTEAVVSMAHACATAVLRVTQAIIGPMATCVVIGEVDTDA